MSKVKIAAGILFMASTAWALTLNVLGIRIDQFLVSRPTDKTAARTYVPDYTNKYIPEYHSVYVPSYDSTYAPSYAGDYVSAPEYYDTFTPNRTLPYKPSYR